MQITIRKPLLIFILALMVVTFVLTLVLAGWVWRNLGAAVTLRDQLAQVAVKQALPINVQLQDKLDILVDGRVDTTVPIKQTLTVPVRQSLDVDVAFDGAVDVNMDIPLHDTVQVDEMMPLETELDVKILGVWTKLPIRGVLPIRLTVPVDTVVPVRQKLKLAFDKPAQVQLNQDLQVPLDTQIKTSVPIHSTLQVPSPPPIQARATILEPADTMITRLDLDLPMEQIDLSWRNPAATPLMPATLDSEVAVVGDGAP